MKEALLEISGLTVEFDADDGIIHAVNDVSLELYPGETMGLVGESGCGKSVTAMSVPRLVPSPPGRVVSGSVSFKGENILALPASRMRELRGAEIGVIFQEPMTALSPLHRVGDQLEECIALHRSMPGSERRALALEWLKKVGIADAQRCYNSYPFELSGGMRQRVMIASALIMEPELVIADEPTTALDVTIQAQILDLLREVTAGDKRSLLLITHDLGVIWEMCDRVTVLYASRVMESASTKELFSNPLHPYTQALMASIPALHRNAETLQSIPGSVPSLITPPAGCPFASRCHHADEKCRCELPSLKETSPGHKCACHKA